MLITSRFRTLNLSLRMLASLALFGSLLAACGEAKDAATTAVVDGGPTPSDVVASDTVPDAGQDQCSLDETCRQSLAVGPCEVARCVEGSCQVFAINDQLPCDDGNPCTVETRCDDGSCVHGVTTLCDDANPCTTDGCDPLTGCDFSPRMDTSVCDDSDPCTMNDACLNGACVGESNAECACETSTDCAPFEDDNLCNGNMHCVAGTCRLDTSSIVTCPEAADCYVSACVPSTGKCATWPAASGVSCNDGDPCSLGDACEQGLCLAGDPICGCEDDADCGAFVQPGFNLCLGPLHCEAGLCVPDASQAIVCEPEGPCMDVACQPDTGLCATSPLPNGTACDASEVCPTEGLCDQGVCVEASPPCDDGDPCTADGCAEDGTCLHEPFEGPCEDGDPCTTGEQCADLVCAGGTAKICDDLNPCTVDACAPALGGCIFEAQTDGVACSSGDPCLEGGACLEGVCSDETEVTCDGDGPCMAGLCLPGEGCVQKKVENGAACDSGSPCLQTGTCQEGVCDSLPLSCNDSNPCTADTCDAEQGGCIHEFKEDGVSCESGDPCMENSQCTSGQCVGGEPVECENGPCDSRSCDGETGVCEIDEVFEDGSACVADLPCQSMGTCEAGACTNAAPCPEDS